jgi:YD repeat-containing protein
MWTRLAILVACISALCMSAQVGPAEESVVTMSDRQQHGLRGSVKSCAEKSSYPDWTDADGKSQPRGQSEYTTEFDPNGRPLITQVDNSDGSQWVSRFTYDADGRLVRIASGQEGKPFSGGNYFYDQQGRVEKIVNDGNAAVPVLFRYDAQGRKTKIETSRSQDYRPNVAVAGSPFESIDRAPNLPGGGTATTLYDDQDRAIEVLVRDANGELVNHALRIYDAEGRIIKEEQVLENPETMIPSHFRTKMQEDSGISEDQLRQELRAQLTKLMAGHLGPYSVTYIYDSDGRVIHTRRRVFNQEDEIETAYNAHGYIESEITRSTREKTGSGTTDPSSVYSEVQYTYEYDNHSNWIRKSVLYRASPDGEFKTSSVTTRTLAYY